MSLIKHKKFLYIFSFIIGTVAIIVGLISNPSFVSKYLSSDGNVGKKTIVLIYIHQFMLIAFGFTISLYSLLKIKERVFAKKIEEKVEAYIIRPWVGYWFTPSSLRGLAIFRILIFGFLIYNLLYLWVPGYIGSLKNVSPEFFEPLLFIRVLHLSPLTSPLALDAIHFLLTIFAVGAMIGFRTRVSIFVSLVLFLYIVGMWWSFEGIHRSESPVFIFALAALLLSPSGKVLSVDEVLARIKALEKRGKFKRERDDRLESQYALWPIRLTQVFVVFAYFNAGFWKLKLSGLSWVNGAALQYHLIDHNFRGHNITDLGLYIAQFPLLCQLLSVLTLIFELGFPLILIFPRLAWVLLPAGVFFHIGTGITMGTWFYPLWFCYIAFINFEAVGSWISEKFKPKYDSPELKVLFDGDCPICVRSMTLIACLDWLKRIDFVDLKNWEVIAKSFPNLHREDCLREMYLIDQDSTIYKGFFAYRSLAKVMPVFWIILPLLYIPGISQIGELAYRWANRRARNAAVTCTIHNCK